MVGPELGKDAVAVVAGEIPLVQRGETESDMRRETLLIVDLPGSHSPVRLRIVCKASQESKLLCSGRRDADQSQDKHKDRYRTEAG